MDKELVRQISKSRSVRDLPLKQISENQVDDEATSNKISHPKQNLDESGPKEKEPDPAVKQIDEELILP